MIKLRIAILTALVTLGAVLSVDAQEPRCTVVVQDVTPDGWVVMTVNGVQVRALPVSRGRASTQQASTLAVNGQVITLFPPDCWVIDEANNAPFKVGDRIWFGRKGVVTGFNLEHQLIFIRPEGDPHQWAIDRMTFHETFPKTAAYPSKRLRDLQASHPGPLCVSGPGLGQELGFPINTPGLKHLVPR